MLRRAAAIGRQGTGSSQIAPPACSALGATQQRLRRLRALATSSGGGSPRRHFASSSSSSSRPDGHETGGAASSLHNGEDGEDEEADEEEEMERLEGLYREQMALMVRPPTCVCMCPKECPRSQHACSIHSDTRTLLTHYAPAAATAG